MTTDKLDQLAINTIRTLSIDAVQQAKSGHPGTPMALAPLVYTVWNRVLRFDPKYPIWPNRDRFVLSNGHASMLLWSVLHLAEVHAVNAEYERLGEPSVTLDDIRHFRQLDSKAPGHPEYHWVPGVGTRTVPLGQGARNKIDPAAAHGEPLGEEEVRLAKRAYGWPEDAKFLVPEGVRQHFAAGIGQRGAEARGRWEALFSSYRAQFPDLAAEVDHMQRRELPAGWDRNLPSFSPDPKGIAGRDASGEVLNVLAQNIPWLLGGSADLGPSNKTTLKFADAGDFEAARPGGRNLHFALRDHAMAAIVNGLSLSKLPGFGATFFIFSDYARPAIRLSALMERPTIFGFTHDAIGDGEDGPTHQPVEQLASFLAIPGLVMLRPADANEVVEAYRYIAKLRHQPAALALSRQPLPTLDRSKYAAASGLARGAYVLAEAPGSNPEVILIGSGCKVSQCIHAHEVLTAGH